MEKLSLLLKDPQLLENLEKSEELSFLVEFLRLISWVREHICERVQIKEFIKLLDKDLSDCRILLSKIYGIDCILFN
jgi:hypothetical protein